MSEISQEALAVACADKVRQLEFSVKQSAFDSVRQELETELAIARVALLAMRERAEPVAYADPQAFRNFQAGTANKEWMWAQADAGLVPVFVEAPQAPVAAGWIACSERMPEREYVLAADFSGAYYLPSLPNTQVGIYADWFEDGKPSWDDGDGNDLHLKQVTHWMPLPEAPTNN